MGPRLNRHPRQAFTLMELMTVMVIISILIVLLFKATATIRGRSERASCVSNLKNLYAGAASYVMDRQQWPQIPGDLVRTQPKEYAKRWINSLAPYGISQKNWLCPSIHREMGGPDMTKDENRRVDYNATPFDSKPGTPYQWKHQPWFVEHASIHDGGPLLILTNGRVVTLRQMTGGRR